MFLSDKDVAITTSLEEKAVLDPGSLSGVPGILRKSSREPQHAQLPGEPTVMLPFMVFDDLLEQRDAVARNALLFGRDPAVQRAYEAHRAMLAEQNTTLQEHIYAQIETLGGCAVRALLTPDEFPADIRQSADGLDIVHYNLWLRTNPEPDFAAGEQALAQLANRDPFREAYCFKRPTDQTVPRNEKLPFEHAHVFTAAITPPGGILVLGANAQ